MWLFGFTKKGAAKQLPVRILILEEDAKKLVSFNDQINPAIF